MKKSKILIPAFGVLILSTAASVTGTVAWFTASRTATITAGDFAVVNTNSNLELALSNGIGVNIPVAPSTAITAKSGYSLTDSSFDHTDTDFPVVVPNASRETVEKEVTLAEYSEANFLRSTGVYSAFAWDMTFSLTFAGGAVYDMGLFLDLSECYVHEAYKAIGGESGSGYYTEASLETPAPGTLVAGTTYYKAAPDATGKGFRVAFIPKTVSGANDIGYTKVWAEHQTAAKSKFVDNPTIDAAIPAGTAYSTATTKKTNGTASAETLTGNKSLISSSANRDTVPAEHEKTHAYCLANNANYLAFLKLNAGNTTSVTFTCLCWYEGTDENIVKEATDFEQVALAMKFAAVELADA